MYEKLLVAVDHSKATEHVLGAARDLALLSKGEVWVVHLREREYAPKAGLIVGRTADDAQAQVDAAVEELTQAGINAHGVVRNTVFGYAAREIDRGSQERRCQRHHHGLPRPRRPGRAGPRQHRAQGDPPGRPARARGPLRPDSPTIA